LIHAVARTFIYCSDLLLVLTNTSNCNSIFFAGMTVERGCYLWIGWWRTVENLPSPSMNSYNNWSRWLDNRAGPVSNQIHHAINNVFVLLYKYVIFWEKYPSHGTDEIWQFKTIRDLSQKSLKIVTHPSSSQSESGGNYQSHFSSQLLQDNFFTLLWAWFIVKN
jgi:hypothetical protein